MRRRSALFILLLSICLAGCQQRWQSEEEEVGYWRHTVTNSVDSILYNQKDLGAALHRFDSLLDREKSQTPYIRSVRYSIIANYHYFFSQDNSATAKAIDSALSFFPTQKLQYRYPRAYLGLLLFGGEIAYRLHQYDKANDYYFQAKNISDTRLAPCERSTFIYNMAMVLYRQQNFRASEQYFKEAYASQATCPVQTTAIALQQQEIQSNIALCQIQLRKYDSALLHLDTALLIANRYRDSLGAVTMDKIYGVVYGDRAKVYEAKGNLTLADSFSRKSIALNARPGYEMRDAQAVQLQLVTILEKQRRFGEMRQELAISRAGLDTMPDPKLEASWRQLMTAYYNDVQQPIEELRYLKSYISLRDSLQKDQDRLVEADITRQLNEKEKELQIVTLRKDNQLTSLQLLAAMIGAVISGLVILLVYSYSRRNKKNLALQKALNHRINLQKAALEKETGERQKLVTEAVIKAQEKERSVIGLELHDNVNQMLTTVKLMVEMVGDGLGDPKQVLGKASHYLQQCINEIRSLSKRLSATTLGKISLEESVRDLVETVSLANKFTVHLDVESIEGTPVSHEAHVALYRIIQEALNNIITHANATEVSISLTQSEKSLQLVVSDNGKGFEISSKKNGIGIVNMRTRAENLNGRLALKSTPGQGSRLEVTIPKGEVH